MGISSLINETASQLQEQVVQAQKISGELLKRIEERKKEEEQV
jgi:hypothetical protein